MATEYPDVVMLKVDVDECEDAAIEYNIQSMPTFVFLKSNKEVKYNSFMKLVFNFYYNMLFIIVRLCGFLVLTKTN